MLGSQMNYAPIALPFLSVLVFAFLVLVVLIQIGALRYAYRRIGLSAPAASLLLLGSLFGSYFNLPIYQLPDAQVRSGEEVIFFGMRYVVPVVADWPGTIIAVNVGGAVIPTLLSLYLLAKNQIWIRGALATLAVAVICHMMAKPVAGIGIAVPIFVPPLAAAIVSVLLSASYAAPLAYISGSLGTLIGADLLNLDKIQGLGAPVASIGGAGTFDGIFLAGIIAVLIASFSSGPVPSRAPR
ncbi:DUF1614 domain-containing protein [Methyloferula stellata]|uniref:DUF1614 domain-containing protein n=1 Tax=Methyloferula stellata TaxID=876270 RepID=UPI00036FFC81|nr:DUF1614 domain-containing protein [Methyloferula stellata]